MMQKYLRNETVLLWDRDFRKKLFLAWDLAKRDLAAKYRRSAIGAVWIVLTPLCLLGIYSFVFGGVFGVNWKTPDVEGRSVGFILPFFVGLSAYLTFSDVVNSSAVLFASKRNYVVKSAFPLWVLWVSNLMRSGVHAAVTAFLVICLMTYQGHVSVLGLLWGAVSLSCCMLFLAGLSLLLSAIGPFVGDISEANRLILRVLFYATPVTYPITLVPEAHRHWMWLNPLTCMVELLRAPLVFGAAPALGVLTIFFVCSVVLVLIASWVFLRVKGVISDVV